MDVAWIFLHCGPRNLQCANTVFVIHVMNLWPPILKTSTLYYGNSIALFACVWTHVFHECALHQPIQASTDILCIEYDNAKLFALKAKAN